MLSESKKLVAPCAAAVEMRWKFSAWVQLHPLSAVLAWQFVAQGDTGRVLDNLHNVGMQLCVSYHRNRLEIGDGRSEKRYDELL